MYKTKLITISNNIRLRQKEVSMAVYQFADTIAEIIMEYKDLFDAIEDEPVRPARETDTFYALKRINK